VVRDPTYFHSDALFGDDCRSAAGRVLAARLVTTARFFLGAAVLVAGYLGLVTIGEVPDLDSGGTYTLFAQSRWGHVFGIPIAFLGSAVYGALLLLSGRIVAASSGWLASAGIALALVTMLAAVYYCVLQRLFVGGMCSYCGIAHGLAMGGACLLLYARVRLCSKPGGYVRQWVAGSAVAVAGLAALAFGQFRQEDKALAVTLSLASRQGQPGIATIDHGGSKLISLYNGRFTINPAHFPVIGAADAENFIVVVTDYTSPACRELHRELVELQRPYGKQLAILELPGTVSLESSLIHRLLLALRELREHEHAALSEAIYASQSLGELKSEYILRDTLKRVPNDAFWDVQKRFGKQIETRIALGRKVQDANAAHAGTTDLPQIMVGSTVLAGASIEPEVCARMVRHHIGPTFPIAEEGGVILEPNAPPAVELKDSTIDLGPVAPGAKIPIVISVTNGGALPLEISWVRFGEDCHVLETPRAPILRGKSADVRLAVSIPHGKLGAFERSLTIHSNANAEGDTVHIVGEFDPSKLPRSPAALAN
jgi:uncharacterized membrane protein